MIVDDKPVRTIPQNRAIHKYFAMLAESLNNAGKDVLTVMNSNIEIEWTGELVELFKDELAIILNEGGLKFNCALGKGQKVAWSASKVKALIWRKVQKMQFDINSTADMNTEQVSKVYEIINRYTGEKFGVSVIFPTKEE